ncbi:sensor histidine kinase [Flexithrix dorotheae]|uniref:sensor histidine kinase n=1 Tax=Flexithrix dorotheae TaxID=70993 RepID=UPI00035DADCB|nr:PAS domain S-box protein [Flexithrix dorotheae]
METTELITKNLVESAHDVVIGIDLAGNIIYCNAAVKSIYGYNPNDLIGSPYKRVLPQEKLGEFAAITENIMFGGTNESIESIRLTVDDRRIKVSVIYSPIKDDIGKLLGISAVERKLTEFRKAQSRSQALIETAPDAMVIVNSFGQIILVNVQTEKLFGYSRQELLGQEVEILIPTRYFGNHAQHRKQFFSNPKVRGMGSNMELYGKKKNGAEFPVEISLGPLETEEGFLVSAAIRDITERKYAEEKFKRLLESAPDAMVIVGEQGKIELVNGQTERLFGYSRKELIGKQVEVLIPERYRQQHPVHRNGYFTKPKLRPMGANLELLGRKKNGEEFPVEISLSPIEDLDKTLVSAAIRDVSQRRYIKQLEHKNRELEQFAYIASHDLQEPLHTINSFVGFLKQDLHDGSEEDIKKYLNYISQASARMGNLISGLLQYSRIGKKRVLTEINCSHTLKEVMSNIQGSIQESEAIINYSELPTIKAYPTEFKQLLQNLLSNAIKFRKKDVPPVITIGYQKDSEKYTFYIQDNGIGISPKHYEQIFIIFQRLHLKQEYEGTGIGLAQCKKIVELHGGKIWVESSLNEGSIFYFSI